MAQKFILIIILCFFWGCTPQKKEKEVYLFSFFQNNGEDGLHLAYSENAMNWHGSVFKVNERILDNLKTSFNQ